MPARHSSAKLLPLLSPHKRWIVLCVTVVAYWLVCFAPYQWIAPISYITNDARLVTDSEGRLRARVNGNGLIEFPGAQRNESWQQVPQELRLRMTFRCTHEEQFGPARIVTLSDNIRERNLMLGQEGMSLAVRLLRPGSNVNGAPNLLIERFFLGCDWSSVDLRLKNGALSLYGGKADSLSQLLSLPSPRASTERWRQSPPILIGNEGSWDRGWAGEISAFLLEVDGETRIANLSQGTVARSSWHVSSRALDWQRFLVVPFTNLGERGIQDIVLNVLGFLPFGMLLMLGWSTRLNLLFAGLLSALLSVSIELGQIAFDGRIPSMTDVITNTVGGMIGFLLGKALLGHYQLRVGYDGGP